MNALSPQARPQNAPKAVLARSKAILRLDDEHHYWLSTDSGERRLPGVNEVIRSCLEPEREGWERGVDDSILWIDGKPPSQGREFLKQELADMRDARPKVTIDPWYLDRGKAVHAAVKLALEGKLDWKTVDQRCKGRVEAILRFIEDEKLETLEIESPKYSELYQFAGCPDWHGILDGRYVTMDYKGSFYEASKIQLGGYDILIPADRSVILECRDAGFKAHWMNKKELRRASGIFLAMLTLYNFKKEAKC